MCITSCIFTVLFKLPTCLVNFHLFTLSLTGRTVLRFTITVVGLSPSPGSFVSFCFSCNHNSHVLLDACTSSKEIYLPNELLLYTTLLKYNGVFVPPKYLFHLILTDIAVLARATMSLWLPTFHISLCVLPSLFLLGKS